MPSASTITLQQTVDVTSIFLRELPLTSVGGFSNEPALTIANNVLGMILSAPLAWPWNRTSVTATLTQGTQDVTVNAPNFGWLETASISFGGTTYALEIKNELGEDSNTQRPGYVSVHSTDGSGNYTFRVLPAPDQAYTLTLNYQKASTIFTSLTQTWTPVPDYLSMLYTLGFRAFCYEYSADPRWINALQLFLSKLVETNDGLNDEEKNLFLWNKLRDLREEQNTGPAPPRRR